MVPPPDRDETSTSAPGAAPGDAPTDDAPDESRLPGGKLADVRAVDIVTRPAEVASTLSADEIAQLEAWFGAPSATELQEKGIELDFFGRPVDQEAKRRRAEARERALEAVDPTIIALLERHVPAGDRLLVFHASLDVHVDASLFERDRITLAAPDITEVERPGDLDKALREAAPQALLRDLHRPEIEFSIEYERPDPSETDIDPFAAAREAMASGHGFAPEPRALDEVRAALRPLAEAKAEPWAELRTPHRRVTE